MHRSIVASFARACSVVVVISSASGCRRSSAASRPAVAPRVGLAGIDPSTCRELSASVAAPSGPLPEPPPLPPAAQEKVGDAVQLVDGGGFDDALAQLAAAAKIAPDHPVVVFETAYVHMQKREYARVIELLGHDTARFGPLAYQALGNAYDEAGKPACALRVYQEGMRAFPTFGGTYFDTGILLVNRGDPAGALEAWERGIARAPLHPSNYLLAAKALQADDPSWAALYTEAFLELEPATRRSELARKLLFGLYRGFVDVRRDGAKLVADVHLTQGDDALIGAKMARLGLAWQLAIVEAVRDVMREIDPADWQDLRLATLHRVRARALRQWRERGVDFSYPHPVIARMLELEAAGLLEAYDHMVFASAAQEEAAVYSRRHEAELDALAKWMSEHPFRPDADTMARRHKPGEAEGSAPVTPALAREAIAAFFAGPTTDRGRAACGATVRFADVSDAVVIEISSSVWRLIGLPEPQAKLERSRWKLCAYIAADARAQLERGVGSDAAYEGVLGVLDVYEGVRVDEAQRSPVLEDLRRRRTDGTLKAHLDEAK